MYVQLRCMFVVMHFECSNFKAHCWCTSAWLHDTVHVCFFFINFLASPWNQCPLLDTWPGICSWTTIHFVFCCGRGCDISCIKLTCRSLLFEHVRYWCLAFTVTKTMYGEQHKSRGDYLPLSPSLSKGLTRGILPKGLLYDTRKILNKMWWAL